MSKGGIINPCGEIPLEGSDEGSDEEFELLYKHHLFKVKRTWYFNTGDWDVNLMRYEGRLQIYGNTSTEVRKEVEEAIRFYDKAHREDGPYAALTLSDFLAKILPD